MNFFSYVFSMQLEDEVSFAEAWLYSHTSDHSAANHLMQSLKAVIDRRSKRLGTLDALNAFIARMGTALDVNRSLIESRPGSETLWILRRNLVEEYLNRISRVCNGEMSAGSNIGVVGLDFEDLSFDLKEIHIFAVELCRLEANPRSVETSIAPPQVFLMLPMNQYAVSFSRIDAAITLKSLSVSELLLSVVAYELQFCWERGSDRDSWNQVLQLQFARRFALHLLFEVFHHIRTVLTLHNFSYHACCVITGESRLQEVSAD